MTNPSLNRHGYARVSATGRAMEAMALFGHRASDDEPDTRPIPETVELEGVVSSLFSAVTAPLSDTGLEGELPDVLWSLVDVFHRKSDRVQRRLDDNEVRQRTAQEQQDGSEIQSVSLERLIDKGRALLEQRAAFEALRDAAAEEYESFTGSAWRPRSSSMVNHGKMTAASIDSRDFLSAKRRSETEVMLPAGPKIVFAGGTAFNDHVAIWEVLDKVLAKHPGMVLLHGGNQAGAERIAACWAANRQVVEIPFKPQWTSAGDKSAPFKRNDRMLEIMPTGVIVFPGNGITDNLADKAKKLGLKVLDERHRGK